MKSYHLAVAVLTSTITPLSGFALGIGNMTVYSSLNEPFQAEIPLYKFHGASFSALKVGLAAPEDYEKIELAHHDVLASFIFEVKRNKQGQPIIQISTRDRLTEPYFELLIRVISPQGEFFRQYPVLLDPPNYRLNARAINGKPLEIKGKTCLIGNNTLRHPTPSIESIPESLPSVSNMHSSIENLYSTFVSKEQAYGPTLPEDRIWDIATQYKRPDLSINQIVLAIVGTNSKAFTLGNLNGLKIGEHLQIPQQDEIKRVPEDLAMQEVAAHEEAWRFKQEIQHVLLPPYIDGIRGISQFDTKKDDTQKESSDEPVLAKSKPANHVPHNVFALNQHVAGTEPYINSQLDVKPMPDHHALTETDKTIKEAISDIKQFKLQLQALQTENQNLTLQIQTLTANFADLKKHLDTLIQNNHTASAVPGSINTHYSIMRRLADFLVMIGSFICGLFAFHWISSKHQRTPKESIAQSLSNNPSGSEQSCSSSQADHSEKTPVQTSEMHPDSEVLLTPEETIPMTAGQKTNIVMPEKPDMSDSRLIHFAFSNESNPVESTPVDIIMPVFEEKEKCRAKEDVKEDIKLDGSSPAISTPEPSNGPIFKTEAPQSHDCLVSCNLNEPANNTPVQGSQDIPNSSIQEAINAPITPENIMFTAKPIRLKSVLIDSNDYIVPFDFSGLEKNELNQSAQPISMPLIQETLHTRIASELSPQSVSNTRLTTTTLDPEPHFIDFQMNEAENHRTESLTKPVSTPDLQECLHDAASTEENKAAPQLTESEPLKMALPEAESVDFLKQFDLNDDPVLSASQEQIDDNTSVNLTTSTSALDTLIDLAKTYMSMEEPEAAKQALEEVIQRGNAEQKAAAQAILEQLMKA